MIEELIKLSEAIQKYRSESKMVEKLIRYAADEPQLEVGDEVRILTGRYQGIKATVIRWEPTTKRLELRANMFGRPVPIVLGLNKDSVEKTKSREVFEPSGEDISTQSILTWYPQLANPNDQPLPDDEDEDY